MHVYDSGDMVMLPGGVEAVVVGYSDDILVCNMSGTNQPVLTSESDVETLR